MRNVIILAGKRTGSTFLQEALNNHPDITCYDEMFMTRKGLKKRRGQFLFNHMKKEKSMGPGDYIKGLFSHDGAISFRLMYPHLEKNKKVIDIINKRNIPIIHLIRKNKIALIVSSKTKKEKKVAISSSTLISEVKKEEKRTAMFAKDFRDKTDYIELYYEDMFGKTEGDKGEEMKYGAFNIKTDQKSYMTEEYSKKVCDFFDVEYKHLFSNVTKRNSWNIWDHVKNKGKIKDELKGTKGEKYLN